jgi:hypothetical protein
MRGGGPGTVLLLDVAAVSAFRSTYAALGVPLSAAADQLSSTILGLAFLWWVVADARRRRRVPCHDFGFLVGVAFPVSLLWYAVWSRGRRGLLTMAGLLGLMALPVVLAEILRVLVHGAD